MKGGQRGLAPARSALYRTLWGRVVLDEVGICGPSACRACGLGAPHQDAHQQHSAGCQIGCSFGTTMASWMPSLHLTCLLCRRLSPCALMALGGACQGRRGSLSSGGRGIFASNGGQSCPQCLPRPLQNRVGEFWSIIRFIQFYPYACSPGLCASFD